MAKDKAFSAIYESWQEDNQKKLEHNQRDNKAKILSQFSKISKEGLLHNAIKEVFNVVLYNKDGALLPKVLCAPAFDEELETYLNRHLNDFYYETSVINEDGFNLMTFFEFILNIFDDQELYWCSYPQISYDIMDEADTYHFTLIQFDATSYKQNLYFKDQLHPFIKSLNYTWMSQHKERSYDNAFRKAASSMNDLLEGTWDHINILSTLKYEGSQNNGSIVFINGHTPNLLLSLEKPVELSNYRQIRKLLQMSRLGHFLLVDANYMAIGFGYIHSEEPIYRIDFLDHLSWKLYLGDEEFLSCYNLLPLLPNIGSNVIKLRYQLKQTFGHTTYNENLLMEIIEEAKFQRKGTMIVVNENAKEEATRLETSSIKIQPTQFTQNQIKMITGIDGAVIIDINGYCHAIGSILDGFATDNGDPSRGARFNSAIRYLNTQKNSDTPCLIAVISEDRYIDIISTSDL